MTDEGAAKLPRSPAMEASSPADIRRKNSLTGEMFQNMLHGKRDKNFRIERKDLSSLSESELLKELVRDIAHELDMDIVCFKILVNVNILTQSDRSSLFLARGSKDERFLVSKLFDVTEKSSLIECLHTVDKQITVPFGRGIAGTVAKTKQPINIPDVYEDPRFNKAIDMQTGYRTRSMLCMPVLDSQGNVTAVAQIINKAAGSQFTKDDERNFSQFLTFCGIALTNARLFELSLQEHRQNEVVIGLAREIFAEQENLDNLVQKILLTAADMLQCERCGVYVLQDDRRRPFDIATRMPSLSRGSPVKPATAEFTKAYELNVHSIPAKIEAIPMETFQNSLRSTIARHVLTKSESVGMNSVDIKREFSKMIDYDGYEMQAVLGVPIYDNRNHMIGVVQLMNKLQGKQFSDADKDMVEAFSIFCGLGVHNCQMYARVCTLLAQQKVSLDVLSYHATAPKEEVQHLLGLSIPPGDTMHLYDWGFDDGHLTDDETCVASVRIFLDLDVMEKYSVPYDVICRFVLSVRKNYRPVKYHNWRHGFNVAQTMITMYFTGEMHKLLSDIEIFALVVACFCHDLDHRGTNNAFQGKINSPLAMLYSTSTMERHHFNQAIMILNSDGNNLFQGMSSSEYKKILDYIEKAILSTDLALYFKKRSKVKELIDAGEKTWELPAKREYLHGILMTACDVSSITKPWEVQFRTAHLVSDEFFEQGDYERDKLKLTPMAMMDRSKKAELPKLQMGFIDAICMPCYEMLATIEAKLKPLLDGVKANRDRWQLLAERDEGKQLPLRPSMMVTHGPTSINADGGHRSSEAGAGPAGQVQGQQAAKKPVGSPTVAEQNEKELRKKSKTCSIL